MRIPRETLEIADALQSILTQVKIKENEQKSEETAEGLDEGPKPDTKDLYSKMLEIMKPGENILKCIKRLGGGNNNKTKRFAELSSELIRSGRRVTSP